MPRTIAVLLLGLAVAGCYATQQARSTQPAGFLENPGQLRPGQEGAPVGGRFERSYRYTVVDTLGGGTSEIQRNIIARRGLELPQG